MNVVIQDAGQRKGAYTPHQEVSKRIPEYADTELFAGRIGRGGAPVKQHVEAVLVVNLLDGIALRFVPELEIVVVVDVGQRRGKTHVALIELAEESLHCLQAIADPNNRQILAGPFLDSRVHGAKIGQVTSRV